MLRKKNIVVGISGGIAAYKTVFLIRQLIKKGAEVQVIMTPNAKEFIGPVTLSSLTGRPVISQFFSANTGEWNSHVDLGLWADIFIIAPATASTIAKMATGVADNMLITSYLSTRAKVFVAPAMDLDMMIHPSTRRNLQTLSEDGVIIIEPTEGELASGLIGKGRMAEPDFIVSSIESYIESENTLKGKKILITAGPTYEKIDPVRFIGNFSTGKMGFAIAEELAARGAEVEIIAGPCNMAAVHPNIKRTDVISAKDMLQEAERIFPDCDAAIMAAAVADYAPEKYSDLKIKREKKDTMSLQLVKNPDISATLANKKRPDQIVVGFSLESNNEYENAKNKLKRKGLDWIILNSLRDKGACFASDNNKITIFSNKGDEYKFDLKSKSEVAKDIADTIFTKAKK